jgi:hypothetical protein
VGEGVAVGVGVGVAEVGVADKSMTKMTKNF